jgi:hypothetical protein
MRRISCLVEELLASEEGLCSMEFGCCVCRLSVLSTDTPSALFREPFISNCMPWFDFKAEVDETVSVFPLSFYGEI